MTAPARGNTFDAAAFVRRLATTRHFLAEAASTERGAREQLGAHFDTANVGDAVCGIAAAQGAMRDALIFELSHRPTIDFMAGRYADAKKHADFAQRVVTVLIGTEGYDRAALTKMQTTLAAITRNSQAWLAENPGRKSVAD